MQFISNSFLLCTACPNSGETVQNGACVCANTFETVQNGICTCPAGQIVQDGACAGRSIYSLDSNVNLKNIDWNFLR